MIIPAEMCKSVLLFSSAADSVDGDWENDEDDSILHFLFHATDQMIAHQPVPH